MITLIKIGRFLVVCFFWVIAQILNLTELLLNYLPSDKFAKQMQQLGKGMRNFLITIRRLFRRFGKMNLKFKIAAILIVILITSIVVVKVYHRSVLNTELTKNFNSIFTANYTAKEKEFFYDEIDQHQDVVLARMSSYYWYITVRDHRKIFEHECKEHGIPFTQAFCHGYMENSGGVAKGSPAGCMGIMQVNPYNARVAGLVVNSKIDQRKDPGKCIHAGVIYLRKLLDLYDGRTDLASAAYHSGQGNMDHFIRLYLKQKKVYLANRFAGDTGAENQRRHKAMIAAIRKYDVKVVNLWMDPVVDRAWRNCKDESRWYLTKVATCEKICWLKQHNPTTYIALRQKYLASYRWEVFFAEDLDPLENIKELKQEIAQGRLVKVPKCKLWRLDGIGAEDPANEEFYTFSKPAVYGLMIYLGQEYQKISHGKPLVYTALTRTREFQEILRKSYPNATRGDTTHMFALALDISKPQSFANNDQLAKFKKVLEKLQRDGKIYYADEGRFGCIHVSINPYTSQYLADSYYRHVAIAKPTGRPWIWIITILVVILLMVIARKRIGGIGHTGRRLISMMSIDTHRWQSPRVYKEIEE